MKRTLTALTVAASIIASGASAYDSKTLEVLENLSKVTIEDLQAIFLGAAQGTLEKRNERRVRLRSAQEDWENHPKAEIDLSSWNAPSEVVHQLGYDYPVLGGLNDGWKTRKAGRYRAEASAG